MVPIEFSNFHTVSVGADLSGRERLDQSAWLVFLSHEEDDPRVVALVEEGRPEQ